MALYGTDRDPRVGGLRPATTPSGSNRGVNLSPVPATRLGYTGSGGASNPGNRTTPSPYTPPKNWSASFQRGPGTFSLAPANPYATVNEDNALASALAAQSMADASAGIQRGLSDRSIGRTNEKAGYDQQALAIDAAANLRQRGYLGDLNAIADRVSLTGYADLNVDERGLQRQYGLITSAKEDARRAQARASGSLADDRRRLGEQEKLARQQEGNDQQRLIAKAAAQGDVGMIGTLDARDLRAGLKDQISEFGRLRNENRRKMEEANDQYFATMRDLNEKWYATDDAVEKVKLRKQMQQLEDEKRRREYQESLARIEDENRQNWIKAALIEIGRRQQVDDLDAQARFMSGAQKKANEDAVLAVQMVAEARRRELERRQQNPVFTPSKSPGIGNLLGAGFGR